MVVQTRDAFLEGWSKWFPGAELPIVLWYSDDPGDIPQAPTPKGWGCFIGNLAAVRAGQDRCFGDAHMGCGGGRTYLGFGHGLRPGFEYFLSYGIPGQMEGERYKKDPEVVKDLQANSPVFEAPARWLLARRIDNLRKSDRPAVVTFMATPDVLSGLFVLSSFEQSQVDFVTAPFSAGCGSVVKYPFLEAASSNPRPVLGLFDVSARPFVPSNTLSFSVPWSLFVRMVDNMAESFLITPSWDKVAHRMAASTTEKTTPE